MINIKRTGNALSYIFSSLLIVFAMVAFNPHVHAQTFAHLSGVVIDQNNLPINDVSVGFAVPGQPYIDTTYPTSPILANFTMVDGEGHYDLNVPLGTYDIVFIARVADNVRPKVETLNIQGDTVLNEQLQPSTPANYTFSGTIKDSMNNPMVGLNVYASSASDSISGPATTTDSTGHYSLSVPQGYWNLFLEGSENNVSFSITPDAYYYIANTDISQNLTLPAPTRTESVTVKDAAGNNLPNNPVSVVHAGGYGDQRTLSSGGDFNRFVVSSERTQASTDSNGIAHLQLFDNTTILQSGLTTYYPDRDQAQNALDIITLDSDQSYTLWDDITPPVLGSINWSLNPIAIGQSTTLSVPVTDNLSGIAHVYYTDPVSGTQPMTLVNGVWTASLGANIHAANTYDIPIWAVDKMGNQSQVVTDILAVYDPLGGFVSGHGTLSPTSSDTMPISIDSSNKANLKIGFTNVKPANGTTNNPTGSLDVQYVIKNNKDEFELSSTSLDWLVVPDSNHASIQGHGDLTTYVNGIKTTVNVPFRIYVTIGTNSPDHFLIDMYPSGSSPSGASPQYVINEDASSSTVKIK